MTTCRKCGVQLDEEAGSKAGRPTLYCSKACRRAAEMEIRRVGRRLGDLEESRATFSRYIRIGENIYIQGWGRPKAALEAVEFEIREAEARLKELLEE